MLLKPSLMAGKGDSTALQQSHVSAKRKLLSEGCLKTNNIDCFVH
jgi:hypothetical protein